VPVNDEAIDFKRRARRRLIGAIALVLFLVIVPPWVMEREPRPTVSSLSVEIPSQDARKPVAKPSASTPPKAEERVAKQVSDSAALKPDEKATSPAAKPGSEAPSDKPKADDRAAGVIDPAAKALKDSGPKKAAEKPADKPVEKLAEKPAEKPKEVERAGAVLADGYVVTIGTFANPDNVKQLQAKLSGEGLKSYTDPVTISGAQQTRVRAGPFPTREAAEKAREKLAAMGLKPGAVAPRQ
jgi:DedD protein